MSVMIVPSNRRYAVRLPVALHQQGRKTANGLLIELSREGARISNLGGHAYHMGDEVTITTACGKELSGFVRWSHDGLAGVRLDRSLHAPEMSELLEANRNADPEPRRALAG